MNRSSLHYQPVPTKDAQLSSRLIELANQYPRYGYLLLHGLLAKEGLVQNKKRTLRLYREQGLQVRTKQVQKNINVLLWLKTL